MLGFRMRIAAARKRMTKAFVFTVVTTVIDETFTLPIYNGGTYDFNVDWGDGNDDDINAWDDAAKTHTYASADTYEITITGTITGFRFANGGDKTKIYNISSWGPLNLGNLNGYFYGCSNLTVTAIDILDLTNTTTLQNAFRSCSSLTTVPSMNSWDVSLVVNMSYTFFLAVLFNQDISSWNVSLVTTMNAMFASAAAFNQDIGGWNTGAVTDMTGMLNSCTVFNQDISSWNVSLVTVMTGMFQSAAAFNQDIGGWNTGAVTNMVNMFRANVPFEQDIGSWNVEALLNAATMFYQTTLDTVNYDALLVGWEAQTVKDNVSFHGGFSKYTKAPSAAATARAELVKAVVDGGHNWTITDGGPTA